MNGDGGKIPRWSENMKDVDRNNTHYDGEERETFLLGNQDKPQGTSINMKPMGPSKPKDDEYNDNGDEDDNWDIDDDDDDDDDKPSIVATVVMGIQYGAKKTYSWLTKITRGYLIKGILLIAYVAYVVKAITYKHEGEDFWRLIGCTIFGIFLTIRFQLAKLIKRLFIKLYGSDTLTQRTKKHLTTARFFIRWFMYAGLGAVMFYVLYTEGRTDINKLRSLPGLIIVLLICLLLSSNPRKIDWHTIYVSMGLQFVCALLFLKWSFGREVLFWIQARLDEFFANTQAGSLFLFGENYKDHYMVFGALPIILIMGATMSVLYYVGAMQLIVNAVGSFLCFVLGTDPVESTAVAAGIFLEGFLAILSLKPFLPKLTKSQLFVVMTSSFSSLGGAYLGVLVTMKVPLEYLFTAMMISAPATFTVCKLIFPETKKQGKKDKLNFEIEKQDNLFDAVQTGSTSMLPLMGNMLAIIFVFLSAISWINHTFTWFGDRVGIEDLTMSSIFSYLLYPISLAMGVETADCRAVAKLWGFRITSSNVIAFFELIKMRANRMILEAYQVSTNFTGPVTHDGDTMKLEWWNKTLEGGTMSVRSEAIVTYSLCGFSSILSVGITLGVFYTFLPQRKKWIATVPIHALIAGNVANLMSGCFASFFY